MDLFLLEERIRELLDTKFQEQAFQDCFLVELHLHGGNKLEVFIDCDSGVTLEKCQQVSRFLEAHIEENQWLGEKYTLDVSSPGLSRPLKLWRQYRKNIGRTVAATLLDGEVRTGILKEVHEDYILLEEKRTEKVGKKKKTVSVETELPFEQIEKTMIVISF
ncbi:MAG: ribosome assembly cofactor RimP [Saprospiraceae bacterium]